ncbi:MAG: fibronectin type III domain-containing protein [Burkholderiales bacterium]|nr:fibronectin type III domain-containing protein [Phycisphaerae bacterium]
MLRSSVNTVLEQLEQRRHLDATYHNLGSSDFSQNWTGTDALMQATNNWTSVPSIIGYLGDGLTNSTATDPQITVAESTTVSLIFNSTTGNGSGGVHEIANDTVALQGSGTADSPYLQFHLNTTGRDNVQISYALKELDSTTVNQLYALQYRVGTTGNFTNVPAGAASGFATAGNQTVNVSVTLPAAVNNQSQVQVRVITNDASGADAMVGVDNIGVTSTPFTGSAPAAPSALSATTISNSQIDLSWTDNSTDETSFTLDRSTSSDFTTGVTTITGIGAGAGTGTINYSDTLLNASTTYYYRVRATNGLTSGNSNEANATTLSGVPSAPGSLAATPVSSSQIDLTWVDSTGETSYILEYSLQSTFSTIATANPLANATNFSVTGLEPGAKYFFRLKGTNGFGPGPYSNTANAATPAAAPTSISFDGTSLYTQNFDNLTTVNTDNTGVGIGVGSNPGAFAAGVTGPLDVVSSNIYSNKNAALNGWAFDRITGSATTPDLGLTPRFAATLSTLASGAAYSYGADSDTDRAFGLLASGSNADRIGATFVNTSGSTTLNNISINFIAETWRAGTVDGSIPMVFEYAVGGAGLNISATTTWTTVTAADLTRTGTFETATTSRDGNNAIYRSAKTLDLVNLGWAPGDKLVIRWNDADQTGSDDGIAVDDFSFGVTPPDAGVFSIGSPTVRAREGGTAAVTVLRQGGSTGPATVAYSLTDGSTNSADYTAPSGTITFADGEISKNISVVTSTDALNETAEQFTITLTGVSGTTAPNPGLGTALTSTVKILDNNGFALSGGAFLQDWSTTDLVITSAAGWDNVLDITGYNTDAARNASSPSVLADLGSNTNLITGGVGEFNALVNPTIGLQGSGGVNGATQPQLIIDLNTQGISGAVVEFKARDIETLDNAVQPINVSYRVGNSGAFISLGTIADATDVGESMFTDFMATLPAGAIGQALVQIQISTIDYTAGTGFDEWVGIDDINIHQAAATLPTWLSVASGSSATWNSGTKALEITGTATIIADPGADLPLITFAGTDSQLLIDPADDAIPANAVHVGSLDLSGGADVTLEARPVTPRDTIVLSTNKLAIGAGSKVEVHNNDLVVDYTNGMTTFTQVLDWVKSGLTILGGAGTTGITSAEIDAQGAGGVGFNGTMLAVVNGASNSGAVANLSGVAVTNPSTSAVVKYTWRGDANLDGVVNGSDYALADTGFSGGGIGWFYGDVNYDNSINGSDYALIDTGFSSQGGVVL